MHAYIQTALNEPHDREVAGHLYRGVEIPLHWLPFERDPRYMCPQVNLEKRRLHSVARCKLLKDDYGVNLPRISVKFRSHNCSSKVIVFTSK